MALSSLSPLRNVIRMDRILVLYPWYSKVKIIIGMVWRLVTINCKSNCSLDPCVSPMRPDTGWVSLSLMARVNWRTHQGSRMKLSVMTAITLSLSLMESLSWSTALSPGSQSLLGRQMLCDEKYCELSELVICLNLPVLIQNCAERFQEWLLHKVLILIAVEKEYLMFVLRILLIFLFLDFFIVHCRISTPLKHEFPLGVF